MRFCKSLNKLFLALVFMLAAHIAVAAEFHPLVIHTEKSARLFKVEIADTPETMAKGLMFRKKLADDKGMLFVFPDEREVAFWMHNTLIPLDMLFIKQDGTIAHIHAMAKPQDDTQIPSTTEVKSVLEIPGGQAAAQGINIGDTVETPLLKDDAE